jgi:hypothetical protein
MVAWKRLAETMDPIERAWEVNPCKETPKPKSKCHITNLGCRKFM